MDSISSAKSRIEIIDALRGFALAGIVIVHVVEQYTASPLPEGSMQNSIGIIDQVIDALIAIFLRGKFFALFSILFGLSFFIQIENSKNKDINFNSYFILRMLLLLIIGYIHSLFYRGDILTIYAMIGLLLPFFQKSSPRFLLIACGILQLGLFRYIVYGTFGLESLFGTPMMDFNAPFFAEYFNTLKNGSLWEVFKSNAWGGHVAKMDFQMGIFGRFYLTLAFFLFGMYLGKKEFFLNMSEKKPMLKKLMWYSLGGLVLSGVVTGISFAGVDQDNPLASWRAMIGLTGADLVNFAMTLIIIAGFCLIWIKKERVKTALAAYGRTALSNYVFQSIIGTWIFYGFGLGQIGSMTNRWAILIAIGIIIGQMYLSKWWLKKYRYGPLEWLWRSLNYRKRQPMLRVENLN